MDYSMQFESEMRRAQAILEDVFGYQKFRLSQREIIQNLIAGQDVLTLMPTGGGKSLCFQIPALIRDGVGIVVSPLIALMKDQVDALRQQGIRAAYLNSSMQAHEFMSTKSDLLQGKLDLVYIAPERLLTEPMLDLLKRIQISLFAIDEAHCVSQWGHDFRKEYQRLTILHQQFPQVPRIALTATADTRTREEIINQLNLHTAAVFIDSFDRPNIRYHVNDERNQKEQLWRFLQTEHQNDAGIIYCLSRKKVESVADWLSEKGRLALPYHAGLENRIRQKHQERFLREEGLIIVATIAFGMGIDKPDVRFVAHLNLPKNIEAYYQETGRAGRDGAPANAWLSYNLQDVILLRQMVDDSDSNEQYKRLSGFKLDAMLGLCELTTCRRQVLLAYFNETLKEPCGNCDNCLTPPKTWDGTQAARKALSCIYRTGQRFGVNYIIEVLTGKQNPRILNNRHHEISTFGIGKEFGNNEWRSVFRQLITRGYIDTDIEAYGALKLASKCKPLLRGEMNIQFRQVSKNETIKIEKKSAFDLSGSERGLFETLRELRRKVAEEQGVPAFIIFHDQSLKEMAQSKPVNKEQLGKIYGVGVHKLKRYGDVFLREIAAHGNSGLDK